MKKQIKRQAIAILSPAGFSSTYPGSSICRILIVARHVVSNAPEPVRLVSEEFLFISLAPELIGQSLSVQALLGTGWLSSL